MQDKKRTETNGKSQMEDKKVTEHQMQDKKKTEIKLQDKKNNRNLGGNISAKFHFN